MLHNEIINTELTSVLFDISNVEDQLDATITIYWHCNEL